MFRSIVFFIFSLAFFSLTIGSTTQAVALSFSTVTDTDGTPLANTWVLIEQYNSGQEIRTSTNSQGRLYHPNSWHGPARLTFFKDGFQITTFDAQSAEISRNFRLRPNLPKKDIVLEGVTTDFHNLQNGNGFVEVGLVFPALNQHDLVNLQVDQLLSPQVDSMRVAGRSFEVPSNISFPRQRERYAIVRLEFNKPHFRFFLPDYGPTRMIASQARFPVRSVVNRLLSGAQMIDVLNEFEFIGTHWQEINIPENQNSTEQNLAVATTKLTEQVTVSATKNSKNGVTLLASLHQNNGNFHPLDIKTLQPSGEQSLKFLPQHEGISWVVAAHSKSLEIATIGPEVEQVAVTFSKLVNLAGNRSHQLPDFFNILAPPELKNDTLHINLPPHPPHKHLATHWQLVAVETIAEGSVEFEIKEPLWEVLQPGWQAEFKIPFLPDHFLPNSGTHLRWIVTLLEMTEKPHLDPDGITAHVSRLTRSAVDVEL